MSPRPRTLSWRVTESVSAPPRDRATERKSPTNLTALPTSFIGRRGSLRTLAESLSRSRLVTVLGPPGTGKTRLVKQYALALLAVGEAPPGGVFFCDLSEATTAADVIARVAPPLSINLGESLPLDEARRRA